MPLTDFTSGFSAPNCESRSSCLAVSTKLQCSVACQLEDASAKFTPRRGIYLGVWRRTSGVPGRRQDSRRNLLSTRGGIAWYLRIAAGFELYSIVRRELLENATPQPVEDNH
jgi:hypothetical protein